MKIVMAIAYSRNLSLLRLLLPLQGRNYATLAFASASVKIVLHPSNDRTILSVGANPSADLVSGTAR